MYARRTYDGVWNIALDVFTHFIVFLKKKNKHLLHTVARFIYIIQYSYIILLYFDDISTVFIFAPLTKSVQCKVLIISLIKILDDDGMF